jgi:Zn-dependent protease
MLPFAKRCGDFATLFITINIATAISNILPIEGYDGYRVITLIFSYYDVEKNWYIILEIMAFIFVFLMTVSSLFFVYTFGNGYWIMAIFMAATISKLKNWMKKSIF